MSFSFHGRHAMATIVQRNPKSDTFQNIYKTSKRYRLATIFPNIQTKSSSLSTINRTISTSLSSSSTPYSNNHTLSSRRNSSTITTDNILIPLIVCGPSGVGKGTIISKYMNHPTYKGNQHFGFTVSHTTRSPRPGEQHGFDYYFTNVDTIQQSISNNDFLEYAQVHGNWYGTSLDSLKKVQECGKFPLLDIDVQGVKNIREYQLRLEQEQKEEEDEEESSSTDTTPSFPPKSPIQEPKPQSKKRKQEQRQIIQAKYIFIAPPSMERLRERLQARGTETPESLAKRTANAAAEMEYGVYPGNFDAIVVNDDLDKAVDDFDAIVSRLYDGHL